MPQIERKLAAIMVADVAGYSAMMERDESRTYARIRALRDELFNPFVTQFGGRIIKTTGDGFLAEFPTGTAALTCAIEMQRKNHAMEADANAQEKVLLRIGINLGDVIIDGDDVSGDGVNVAARLEPFAPHDGICVSSAVRDQVRNDLDVLFEDMGDLHIKNISRPIHAYRINLANHPDPKATAAPKASRPSRAMLAAGVTVLAGAVGAGAWYMNAAPGTRPAGAAASSAAAAGTAASGAAAALPGAAGANDTAGSLSILVLPFANQTGDPQKAYVADALTASITADLSRIRDAYVSPPATAQSYKDKALTARQLGQDAGVRFLLQGNVLSSGAKVRINVTLANTQTGATLWTDTLDGDLTNLFALQDHVTQHIGNNIGRQMVVVAASDSEKRTSTPTVADLTLRASALRLRAQTLPVLRQIEKLEREVLARDPDNVGALTDLAVSLFRQAYNFGNQTDATAQEKLWTEVHTITDKVRELDPNNADILYPIGFYASKHDDFSGWRRAADAYLVARPKSLLPYIGLANLHIALGEPKVAISRLQQAIALDPRNVPETIYTNMARAHLALNDNAAAQEWCQKGVETYPAYPNCYAILAMVYGHQGDSARLANAKAGLQRVAPRYVIPEFVKPQPSSPASYRSFYDTRYVPMWRKAGLPE